MTRRLSLLFAAVLAVGACRSAPAGESVASGGIARAGDAEPALVDVGAMDSTLLLDMRYATPDNFLGRAVYDAPRCLLVADAADRLLAAELALRQQGYRLVVWDCYRPRSVQWLMWEIVPDENYVADPRKGSRHNRGAAVDVGLRALDGSELPIPTEHDDFTPRAARDYMDLPPEAIANRERLERAMADQGWLPLPSEWWHFDAPGWERYPLRDESLAPR